MAHRTGNLKTLNMKTNGNLNFYRNTAVVGQTTAEATGESTLAIGIELLIPCLWTHKRKRGHGRGFHKTLLK